jgi:hypothetical protein
MADVRGYDSEPGSSQILLRQEQPGAGPVIARFKLICGWGGANFHGWLPSPMIQKIRKEEDACCEYSSCDASCLPAACRSVVQFSLHSPAGLFACRCVIRPLFISAQNASSSISLLLYSTRHGTPLPFLILDPDDISAPGSWSYDASSATQTPPDCQPSSSCPRQPTDVVFEVFFGFWELLLQ